MSNGNDCKTRQTKRSGRTVSTLAELAAWCGVSRRTMADWKQEPGFPIEGDGTYCVRRVIEWRIIRTYQVIDPAIDAELTGTNSPMLERLREEKWLVAKLDRQEKTREVIPRGFVQNALTLLGVRLRSLGEDYQRSGMVDAYERLDAALADLEDVVAKFYDSFPLKGFDNSIGADSADVMPMPQTQTEETGNGQETTSR